MSARLFVDLSAVYLRAKELAPDLWVDYAAMMAAIAKSTSLDIDGGRVLAFSSITSANEKQTRFLEGLRRPPLRWKVETRPARLAEIARDALDRPIIRFDAALAFAIGVTLSNTTAVVVVSDSFGLEPVLAATAGRGVRVMLCFWGSCLDARWHAVLRHNGPIEFIDLDRAEGVLGDRLDRDRTPSSFLRDLL